jgi:hypothetical protein
VSTAEASDGIPSVPSADFAASLSFREKAISEQAKTIQDRWRESRHPPVRGVCEDVALVAAFIGGMTGEDGSSPLRSALAGHEAYRTAIKVLRESMREVHGSLDKAVRSAARERDGALRKLMEDADRLLTALRDATAAVRDVVEQAAGMEQPARHVVERFVDDIDDKLVARGSMTPEEARARRLVSAINGLLEKARRATGGVGALGLGREYARYARHESQVATALRCAVGGLAIAVAWLALWFHHGTTEATLLLEVARLSATVPLGVLAIYLARESTRHRTAARRARELAIALQTVDTYIADSTEADGHTLRQALGMRAFGPPTGVPAANPSESDLLHSVIIKVTETVTGEVLDRLGLAGKGEKGGGSGEAKPDSHTS